MKPAKVSLSLFAFYVFIVQVCGRKCDFVCGNKFIRYNLDNDPAKYGLSAGYLASGEKALIGLGLYLGSTYNFGRLQLNPPGLWLCNVGKTSFLTNDSSQIWYLKDNPDHRYKWVDSQDGEVVKNAIEIGLDRLGFLFYIGRIKRRNEPVIIGAVLPCMGVIFYEDNDGTCRRSTHYQVLTCTSCKREQKILPPRFDQSLPPNVDSPPGCVHTWVPYDNDKAPTIDGISAGLHATGVEAYIGKGKDMGVFVPGRIQTTRRPGFYSFMANRNIFLSEGSYYLADNPRYTYKWITFDGTFPNNVVFVRNDKGPFAVPIARLLVDGQARIGRLLFPSGAFADVDGFTRYYGSFEVLTCDP